MDVSGMMDSNPDSKDDVLISEPVSFESTCAEIPESEDTAFRAVRFNDLTTLERRIHEGFDVNTEHIEVPGDMVYIVKDMSRMMRPLRLKQYTLLHVAVAHGDMETIESILAHGACVNVIDQNHVSPLSLASAIQRPDVVKLLIQKGADVNSQSMSGRTPLIQAVENNNISIVKLLMDAGADPDLADMKGTTPMMSFISVFSYKTTGAHGNKNVDLDILRELIKGGSKVNLPNKQGATPLMLSIGRGGIEAAKVLLETGADINMVDKSGKSVFHMAAGVNTALFLINNGAAIDLPDKSGIRPLDHSANKGHIAMLRLLLLCDCLRSTAIEDLPIVVQARRNLPVFDKWLHQELYNPRELKRLCRQTIRQCLLPNRTTRTDELPIPRLMKDYLLAKHLDMTFDGVALNNVVISEPVSLLGVGLRLPR